MQDPAPIDATDPETRAVGPDDGGEPGLLERLLSTPRLRRLLPVRLDVAVAELRGRRAWEHNALARSESLAAMSAILGGTERASELDRLARDHLIEMHVRDVFFWRPWRAPRVDRESRANLAAAVASGRAVLASSCHIGPFFQSMGAVGSLGQRPWGIAGPWLFEEGAPGAWGRRIERWRAGVAGQGERLVRSGGAFEQIAALLAESELVQIYFDMPGGRASHFLKKQVMLAGGTARLAKEADALVLPIHTRRRGHRAETSIGAAVDVRDYAGPDELHKALLLIHERAILLAPEQLENPNRDGAWAGAATADEWGTPGAPAGAGDAGPGSGVGLAT
jgi:lauroyl/myristoyl acyltransferase